MGRKTKALAVSGGSGVSTGERDHVRARDRACARMGARAYGDTDLGGDTGDTGDTSLDPQATQADQPSPVVSPVVDRPGDALAVHEVRALEVRFLAELPARFTLTIVDRELDAPVVVSTSRARVQQGRARRELVWAPVGFETAAFAVQEGRAGAREWRWWCRALRDASWRLSASQALRGGPSGDDEGRALEQRLEAARRVQPIGEPRITVGRFLDTVGAELVGVTMEAG